MSSDQWSPCRKIIGENARSVLASILAIMLVGEYSVASHDPRIVLFVLKCHLSYITAETIFSWLAVALVKLGR